MENAYIKNGNSYFVMDSESLQVSKLLPIGVYTVNPTMQGYMFTNVDDFAIPARIYGDTKEVAERIMKTYHSRDTSTGVLLMGTKGSGKTLLSKYISSEAAKEGFITLIINKSLYGDGFNTLIQSIKQPTVLIFDEFEKIYDLYDQERMLTLFDGVVTQKKLFIVTCNNRREINENIINRPGRMYYAIEFYGLPKDFVKEYCDINLVNKGLIESVIEYVASSRREFSFDMLQALVEEMNRYGEPVDKAGKLLNINV